MNFRGRPRSLRLGLSTARLGGGGGWVPRRVDGGNIGERVRIANDPANGGRRGRVGEMNAVLEAEKISSRCWTGSQRCQGQPAAKAAMKALKSSPVSRPSGSEGGPPMPVMSAGQGGGTGTASMRNQ